MADLQKHRRNRKRCSRSSQTTDATDGARKPENIGANRQRYEQAKHVRSMQTEADKGPAIYDSIGPLTFVTAQKTDTEIDRAIDDAKRADKERSIIDENGKAFKRLPSLPTIGPQVLKEKQISNMKKENQYAYQKD